MYSTTLCVSSWPALLPYSFTFKVLIALKGLRIAPMLRSYFYSMRIQEYNTEVMT
jgi:hypothetical protein